MNNTRSRFSRYHLEVAALRVLRPLGIVFFVLITLFPFYYMVLLSMREISEVIDSPGQVWIGLGEFTTDAYERVLKPTSEGGQGFVRFLLTGGAAGTDVLATQVYSLLTARADVGASAAVAMVMGAVLAVFLVVYLRFFGERERIT